MTIYELYGEIQALMCDPKRDHLLELDLERLLYKHMLQLAADIHSLHPARTPEMVYLVEKAVEDFIEEFN